MTPADLLLWLSIVATAAALIVGLYRAACWVRSLAILVQHTERRSRQLETNGGSHIADQLNRMDDKLDALGERVAVLETHVAIGVAVLDHEGRVTAIHPSRQRKRAS